MGDIKSFLRVRVGMGNFPSKFRGMGGFGFGLTGNFGAGSKILPREGLYYRGVRIGNFLNFVQSEIQC